MVVIKSHFQSRGFQKVIGTDAAEGPDLNVVFERADQFPVHLPRLGHSDAAPFCLSEAVLQDAARLVGLIQLQL